MKKPSLKIGSIITTFNDIEYIRLSLRSVYPFVDYLSICEGSYLENQRANDVPPRSDDGTIDIIKEGIKKDKEKKIIFQQYNGESDREHRNKSLEALLEKGVDFVIINDTDELIPPNLWDLIYHYITLPGKDCYYFKSQTFVNSPFEYCWQSFPRLFRVKPGMQFVGDNYISYTSESWNEIRKGKIDLIPYYHFAFCKGSERFTQKKLWWESRFGKEANFHYDWNLEGDNIIPENHKIFKWDRLPKWLEQELRKDGKIK